MGRGARLVRRVALPGGGPSQVGCFPSRSEVAGCRDRVAGAKAGPWTARGLDFVDPGAHGDGETLARLAPGPHRICSGHLVLCQLPSSSPGHVHRGTSRSG